MTVPTLPNSTTITLRGEDTFPDMALGPQLSGSTSDLHRRRRKIMTGLSAATGHGAGLGEGLEEGKGRRKMPAIVRDELIRVLGSRGKSAGETRPLEVQLSKTGRKRFHKKRGRQDLIQSVDFARVGHNDCQENDCDESMEEEEEEERMCEGGGGGCDEGEGGAEGGFRSLLLFVPLRLGQEKFNMEYKEALKV